MEMPQVVARGARSEASRQRLFTSAVVVLAGTAVAVGSTLGLRGADAGGPLEGGGFRLPAWTPSTAEGATLRPPPADLVIETSNFDELLALFAGGAKAPAAKAFVEAFRKQPELNRMWKQVVDEEGEAGQALEPFARELTQRPEFRQLLAKFAQDPGSRQTAFVLAQAPRLAQLLRGPLVRARSGRSARLGTHVSQRLARAIGGLASGARLSALDSSGRASVPAGPLLAAAGPISARPGRLDAPPSRRDSSSGEADSTTPLAQVPSVGASSALDSWASLCSRADPRLSQRLCGVMASLAGNPYSAWGACIAGEVYDQCALACRDIPELRCRPAKWIDACLEAYSPQECRRRCFEAGRDACGDAENAPARAAFHVLGYDRLDGKLVANPGERTTVAQLYGWYAAGLEPEQIARKLNERGLRHKITGERFTAASVLTVMRRKTYKGLPGVAEAIVSAELWERARARMLREGQP